LESLTHGHQITDGGLYDPLFDAAWLRPVMEALDSPVAGVLLPAPRVEPAQRLKFIGA
jgi:hypothetical protein